MKLLTNRKLVKIFSFLIIISCCSATIFSQSKLFVGILTIPTYLNNYRTYQNNVYEYYEGLDHHQFYIANGVSIEYKLGNTALVVNPNFFKRKFNNNCIDSKLTTVGDIFFTSKQNCKYKVNARYDFLSMPVMLKFRKNKKSNLKLDCSVGNSIIYGFKKKSSLKELDSNIEVYSVDSYSKYFISWFSPTIKGGGEFILSKNIIFDTNISFLTEKPLFTNFSLGLNIGLKMRL